MIKGNIQEQMGISRVKCDKELSYENQTGVRSPERKSRARSKKGEEEVMQEQRRGSQNDS